MSLVRKINGKMNNDYVKHIQLIELDDILKDLYISDYLKEDLSEERFLEYYEAGEYEIVVVQYDYDKVVVGLNSFTSDPAKYVFSTEDGVLFVSGMHPSMEYQDGTYYAGDEVVEVGKKEPYESKTQWGFNSISEVECVINLPVSKETMKKIVEGIGE